MTHFVKAQSIRNKHKIDLTKIILMEQVTERFFVSNQDQLTIKDMIGKFIIAIIANTHLSHIT